jgi:para-aminobenzoate synthetase/4-amino-4-deoxychorismate lyase
LDDFRQLLQTSGTALLRKANAEEWMLFTDPFCVLQTDKLHDVLPMLAEVERLTQRQGLYAAGFIAYEAARAFDPAFRARPPGELPLIWFAVYEHFVPLASLPQAASSESLPITDWRPEITAEEFRAALGCIRDYIAAGDTYQVNYTFRLRGPLREDPAKFFARLCAVQPTPFSAFIHTGAHIIGSASPELFFDLSGAEITCRPMKGTRTRGRHAAEDRLLREQLRESRKDRAENLMIVDMLRNDLGRIAAPGTVRVRSLFDIEQHPTVWQMTSTVHAETRAPLVEILRALFPCASITGAPKIRTMQIIAELEKSPRGVYTGAVGFIAPDRRARFSVAIRTACVKEHGHAEYGVGAGILWDSEADTEYAECLAKAQILRETPARFELLETLLWEPLHGFRFEQLHRERLADSAEYFGYPCDQATVMDALGKIAAEDGAQPQRVRLLLARDGSIRTERSPAPHVFCERPELSTVAFRVVLARSPVCSADRFLYHKTTNRAVYDAARRDAGWDADDVILWNERGEATESAIANIVAVFGGEWITPPVSCGLLPGVFRRHLLQTGRLRERTITVQNLVNADALYLINSVRGWIACVWADERH